MKKKKKKNTSVFFLIQGLKTHRKGTQSGSELKSDPWIPTKKGRKNWKVLFKETERRREEGAVVERRLAGNEDKTDKRKKEGQMCAWFWGDSSYNYYSYNDHLPNINCPAHQTLSDDHQSIKGLWVAFSYLALYVLLKIKILWAEICMYINVMREWEKRLGEGKRNNVTVFRYKRKKIRHTLRFWLVVLPDSLILLFSTVLYLPW
jgi:hypothetical protein